ncbi:hypothetical protein Goshw_010888 [Gossypium schwendimanii]|uniref:Disease resistance protein At4g27190-like leucine-rich repeats domain-containing protein n=1 Tax=Gossypium schwendimanii TaxID=34291 RepID=A0A7J9N7T9_GOSSC|nr:hypothetical protein [Gossypium schwendimanii]
MFVLDLAIQTPVNIYHRFCLLTSQIIPQLEAVSLTADDVAMISDGQFAVDFFYKIKFLRVSEYLNESADFFHFLQRFPYLKKLHMVSCNLKELSPYEVDVSEERDVVMMLPRINMLTLQGVDEMTHLGEQGYPLHHICANLKTLRVYQCDSLINLSCASSYFRNLITLDVWDCKEMVGLITSSNAQCLEWLIKLRIRECEIMREVIVSNGDESTHHEIIFRKLKCLELYCLQNLKSFCLKNITLKFPSLDEVTVTNCPTMENFCGGALSTPKLQMVQLMGRRWAGDLNASNEQLNTQVLLRLVAGNQATSSGLGSECGNEFDCLDVLGYLAAHNEWIFEGCDEDPVNIWNNALKGYHNFMFPPTAPAIKLI